MGLLRTILIILLIYYGVKVLSRIFAPFLVRFVAKKAEQKFGGYQNQANDRRRQKEKEGETVIDKMPQQPQKSNEKVGEYIDFEEID